MYILKDWVWAVLISFNILALVVPGLAALLYEWTQQPKKVSRPLAKTHPLPRRRHPQTAMS